MNSAQNYTDEKFGFGPLLPPFLQKHYDENILEFMSINIFQRFSSKRRLFDNLIDELILIYNKGKASIEADDKNADFDEPIPVKEVSANEFRSYLLADGSMICVDKLLIESVFVTASLFCCNDLSIPHESYVDALSNIYLAMNNEMNTAEVLKNLNPVVPVPDSACMATIGEILYTTDATLRFVVAHEFSHAVKQHGFIDFEFRLPNTRHFKSFWEQANRDIKRKKQLMEIDADMLASSMLASSLQLLISKEPHASEYISWIQSLNVGPILFLALHDLFEYVEYDIKGDNASFIKDPDHLPTDFRKGIQAIHWAQAKKSKPDYFKKQQFVLDVLQELKPSVAEKVRLKKNLPKSLQTDSAAKKTD